MAKFTIGDWFAGMLWLIALFLIVNNWQGANQILATAATNTTGLVKTLQGR